MAKVEYLPLKTVNQFMFNSSKPRILPVGNDYQSKPVMVELNWGDSLYMNYYSAFVNGKTNKRGPLFPPTEDEYLRFFLSGEFTELAHTKPEDISPDTIKYPELINMIDDAQEKVLSQLNGKALKKYINNIEGEIIDQFAMIFLLNRWVKNKQVIKPDATFAYYLTMTDKLTITKDILEHLPYSSFYLDLSDCKGMFEDALGAFVFITKTKEDCYSLAIYLICDDQECALYSNYMHFYDLDKEDAVVDVKSLTDISDAWDWKNPTGLEGVEFSQSNKKLPDKSIKTFVMQLLCYMSADKPDIVPNKEMTNTYRPTPNVIKNKFREVFINDVGYRVGANLLKKKKEVEELYTKSEEYANENPKTRKPPCAHYRRAHWHGYWTGKGRTEYITKWVEPVFVCGSFSSEAVIHKASLPNS